MKYPVLFIVFNRPECTKQSFETIRAAKPPRLYIAADGPRGSRPQERDLCEEVRSISSKIDWPCHVQTLYSASNLGCKRAVIKAIDWFFQHEEAGIIMEDDICASPAFFDYIENLLDRYKDVPEVGMIAGTSLTSNIPVDSASYYFSEYAHIWGWGTWKRAWSLYSSEMEGWEEWFENVKQEKTYKYRKYRLEYWRSTLSQVSNGQIDTWDYQWQYAMIRHQMLCAVPNTNLIDNIGFGPDATHTRADKPEFMKEFPRATVNFPLAHPSSIAANINADRYIDTHILALDPFSKFRRRTKNFGRKLKRKLVRFHHAQSGQT